MITPLLIWMAIIGAAIAVHYWIIEVKKQKPVYWMHVVSRILYGGGFIALFTGYPFSTEQDPVWLLMFMLFSWLLFFNYGLNLARIKFAGRQIPFYHLGDGSRWDRFSKKLFPLSVIFYFRCFLFVIGLMNYLFYWDRSFWLMVKYG